MFIDLVSSSFTNNHLQKWVDYIDEKNLLNHLEIQAIHHLLQILYRNVQEMSLFKLLLDDYPSLIQLLDRLIGKSEWLAPLTKPILSIIYLVMYKAIVESGEFSDKHKIINTILILLRNCGRVRREENCSTPTIKSVGSDDHLEIFMSEINFELVKNNTRGGGEGGVVVGEGGAAAAGSEYFESVFVNMINERCFDMIYNNFGLGIEIHITFARLCLSFLLLGVIAKKKNVTSLIENYLNELISRFDWTYDSPIISEFIQEIMISKIITPQQKSIILMSNDLLLVDKFSDCLNYLLKNPFKVPEIHDDSKIILETVKRRPSISFILEGFLEMIYKETQHPRIFFIGNSILKNQTIHSISKDKFKKRIDKLNQTIHNKWMYHQYKHFQMFLTSTIHIMTILSENSHDPFQDDLFSTCHNYVTQFIFGSDSTKDLNFCKDSLLHFLKDLLKCKEFTKDQFELYLNGEEDKLQSFPFNFILYIYLCAVFARNDSKHFSYNQVIDLSFFIMESTITTTTTTTLGHDLFVEVILILIQWFEHVIDISGSDHQTFSLRQLIIILSYLKIISHMNDRVNQTDDFELKGHLSMLLSRFKFKYYENIQQCASSDFSQQPNNNQETKQSLINLTLSTFENLYIA